MLLMRDILHIAAVVAGLVIAIAGVVCCQGSVVLLGISLICASVGIKLQQPPLP